MFQGRTNIRNSIENISSGFATNVQFQIGDLAGKKWQDVVEIIVIPPQESLQHGENVCWPTMGEKRQHGRQREVF
jgi:hypothetical protein